LFPAAPITTETTGLDLTRESNMASARPIALGIAIALSIPGCSKVAQITAVKGPAGVSSTTAANVGFAVTVQPRAGEASPTDPASARDVASNLAPVVKIVSPSPSPLFMSLVVPGVRIRITGADPDGPAGRPDEYRWLLIQDITLIQTYRSRPDSLRRLAAPDFEGWNTLGGNVTEFSLPNLEIDHEALLAIVATDRQGASTQTFSLSTNMLHMYVVYPNTPGPRIGFTSTGYSYEQAAGSLGLEPAVTFDVTAPQQIAGHWYAITFPGETSEFRYGIDLPADALGWDVVGRGWSSWKKNDTSATIAVEAGRVEPVLLTIQARDTGGRRSMLRVAFRPVAGGVAARTKAWADRR